MMNQILDTLPENARQKLAKVAQPDWVDPMLATLTDDYFSDEQWLYERKLDGERCLVYRDGDSLRLLSRNQKELNLRYPELEQALAGRQARQFIIDGEIVAFKGRITSFSRLQQRMHIQHREEALASDVAVYYYIFDLLYWEGHDTSQLALRHRKSLLKRAFDYADPLRFTTHRNREGVAYHQEACRRGWEGIIAKDATSPYVHGRSRKWLKFKCVNQQELVIGGFTDPQGERIGFGALLLGFYEDGALRYAGKVGTGFDDDTLRRLHDKLQSLEQDTPPYAGDALPDAGVHWVKPDLVAEIGFEEWTDNDRLRHPRYLGLRNDKDAKDVIKEEPAV
jgi:bifunctional non-homologous end joining protein LigD